MEQRIYVKSEVDGKMIAITAILPTVQAANEYLTDNPEEGVIYQYNNLIFIARNDDLGY